MITYQGNIMKLEPNQILVFDSNTEGRHGKGNALMAYKHFGAIYGHAHGLQGQSYAICTKDLKSKERPSIDAVDITNQIDMLYRFAAISTPELEFLVGYTLATNLNGYTSQEMANMFALAGPIPGNIVFNDKFAELIDTSLWAPKTIL